MTREHRVTPIMNVTYNAISKFRHLIIGIYVIND